MNEYLKCYLVIVHDFVASQLDHCCSCSSCEPTSCAVDRVLRSAARLIGHVPVSSYMRDILHWLPVSQRIITTHLLLQNSWTGLALPHSHGSDVHVPEEAVLPCVDSGGSERNTC